MQQCGGCDSSLQTHINDPANGNASASLVYPTWLHNQMQAESPKDWSTGGEWFPNYNSPSFLAAWKALNVAVNNHIMNTSYNAVRYQDVIFEIDVRGYGEYGEWTENVFTGAPSGAVATSASLKTIIDGTVQSYPTFQCVAMQATFDANQLNNTMIPPDVGYYALTTSNTAGVLGWRRDNWGCTDPYDDLWTDTNSTSYSGLTFSTAINARYKLAPVVGEPTLDGTQGEFAALPGQMTQFHVTSFGNGNVPGDENDSTVAANFLAASKAAGYRLVVTGGTMTTSLSSGGAFNISLNWQNVGAAPVYRTWNVTFELRSSANTAVWTGTSTFNPRLFLPSGTATAANDSFTLPTVSSGTYGLYLVIRDPKGYLQPLPLGITGRNSDGSYLICSVVASLGSLGICSAGT